MKDMADKFNNARRAENSPYGMHTRTIRAVYFGKLRLNALDRFRRAVYNK